MRNIHYCNSCPRLTAITYRVIIKLGTTGTVHGFDVDTAHFNGKLPSYLHFAHIGYVCLMLGLWIGNEAPEVSIDAMFLPDDASPPDAKDSRVRDLHHAWS